MQCINQSELMMKPFGFSLFTIVLFALLTVTQTSSAERHKHVGHGSTEAFIPSSSGQSAFAAISEIVAILRADPDTNWSNVNVDALRRHLQDMNELTLNAIAETEVRSGEIVFFVAGRDRTYDAIQRMVPAHARELNKLTNLSAAADKIEGGFTLSIRSGNPDLLAQISAIGFFGIMTLGAHHPEHHLAIAKGELHDH